MCIVHRVFFFVSCFPQVSTLLSLLWFRAAHACSDEVQASPLALLHYVCLLEYEFALLVFLGFLECLFVFPAQDSVTRTAVYVCHRVQPCDQKTVLLGTQRDVHHVVKQVCSTVSALESLGNYVVVVCGVTPTLRAAVNARAVQKQYEGPSHFCSVRSCLGNASSSGKKNSFFWAVLSRSTRSPSEKLDRRQLKL